MNYLCQLFQKFWPKKHLPYLCVQGFLRLCFRRMHLDLYLHEILFQDLLSIILNSKSSLNLYLMILFLLRFHLEMIITKHFVFFMIIVKSFHFLIIIFKALLVSISFLNFHFSIIITEKCYKFVISLLSDC